MRRISEQTEHRPRLRPRARWWASCAACALVVSGCATKPVVISACPAPNVDEQDDLENFMVWEPDRPAALYMARVLGEVHGVELREVRGEQP